jgi:hypothetical protein
MSNEKNDDGMEIEENPKIEQEKEILDNAEEKSEKQENLEKKEKKKIIKRAPMEKTVDETIKEFDKLLSVEVSILLFLFFRSLTQTNSNLYSKN